MRKNFFTYATIPISLTSMLATSPAKTAENPFKEITVTLENVLFQDYSVETKETTADAINDSSNLFNLSEEEKMEVGNIFSSIKVDENSTYAGFLNQLNVLSDKQKIFTLGVLGGLLLENYDYDLNLGNISGGEFFSALKTYLQTGEKTPTGICGSIHQEMKNIADILGFEEAVNFDLTMNNNNGHIALALKNNDKWYIIDYNNIIEVDSKNFRKALETKALSEGRTMLHSYIWDNDFKFELWTRDGQMFNQWIEYDPTTETTRNKLFGKEKTSRGLELKVSTYANSAKIFLPIKNKENSKDSLFLKVGTLKGTEISPLQQETLYQLGLVGKKGNEKRTGEFAYKVGILYSTMKQNAGTENPIIVSGDVSYQKTKAGKDNEVSFIINGSGAQDVSAFQQKNNSFSNDPLISSFRVSAGTSFMHNTENASYKTYILSQGMPALNNPSEQKLMFKNSENRIGLLYQNEKFSINPEWIQRLEEDVAALSFGFEKGKVHGKIGIEKGESNFKHLFPNREAVNIGAELKLKKIGLNGSIRYADEDWNGENDKNFSAYFGINF